VERKDLSGWPLPWEGLIQAGRRYIHIYCCLSVCLSLLLLSLCLSVDILCIVCWHNRSYIFFLQNLLPEIHLWEQLLKKKKTGISITSPLLPHLTLLPDFTSMLFFKGWSKLRRSLLMPAKTSILPCQALQSLAMNCLNTRWPSLLISQLSPQGTPPIRNSSCRKNSGKVQCSTQEATKCKLWVCEHRVVGSQGM